MNFFRKKKKIVDFIQSNKFYIIKHQIELSFYEFLIRKLRTNF